jgi:UrcA family protein
MNRISIARCVASGLLAAAVLPFSAIADERQGAAEIVIRSQGAVKTEVGRTYTNFPIVVAETRQVIDIKGLDLATPASADALLKVVRTAARKGCAQLESLFANSDVDPSCVSDAVKGAMPQIEAAIAEAKGMAQPSELMSSNSR